MTPLQSWLLLIAVFTILMLIMVIILMIVRVVLFIAAWIGIVRLRRRYPPGWVNPLSNFGDDENDRMPWQQD